MTTPRCIIRRAEVSDADDIAGIHVRSYQHAYKSLMQSEYLESLTVEKQTAKWQKWLEGGTTLVAESEQKLLGFCSVGETRDEDLGPSVGEVYALYIEPGLWRGGIGTNLCNAGLQTLWEAGFERVMLWVLAENVVGRGFYEKHGFSPDGHEEPFRVGDIELPELRYVIVAMHQ